MPATTASMMSFPIQSAASGNKATIRRKHPAAATNLGPDSQSNFKTGGKFFRAERRSRQGLQADFHIDRIAKVGNRRANRPSPSGDQGFSLFAEQSVCQIDP